MDFERRLSHALQSGDIQKVSDVFSCIYHQYFRLVVFIVLHEVGSSQAAEDIAQDIFVGLFEKLVRGEEVNNIESYLRFSARNRSINYFKREPLVVFDEDFTPDEIPDTISNYYEDELFIEELKSIVTPDELNIVIDYVFENLTWAMISKRRGRSLSYVKKVYNQATQKLKEAFGGSRK